MVESLGNFQNQACQYCERHGLVCVVLGNGTVHLCPVSADMDKQGPGDIAFWVRAVEGSKTDSETDSETDTSTEAKENNPYQLP